MKTMYWRAGKLPLRSVMFVCVVSVGGVGLTELVRLQGWDGSNGAMKLAAAELAARGMAAIKAERLRRGHVFHAEFDPAESGMIGDYDTPITSVSGNLASKQTSVNPNFAAVIVDMLRQAGVGKGDVVAVGCSGSFPTLNLCLYAALETLQAEPIIIASAAASQYGANMPDLMWIDMERHLVEQGLLSIRSVAASIGGAEDRGATLTDAGRSLVVEAIRRNGLFLLPADDFQSALDIRMEFYHAQAGGRAIKAYVNVGGGTVSVGRSVGKKLYAPGLNLQATPAALAVDSVMTRFARTGTPIVHLVEVLDLARVHGLPAAPRHTPAAGTGSLYHNTTLSRWTAGLMLLVVGGTLWFVSRRRLQPQPTTILLTTVSATVEPARRAA